MLIPIHICLSCKAWPFDGGPIERPDILWQETNCHKNTPRLISLISKCDLDSVELTGLTLTHWLWLVGKKNKATMSSLADEKPHSKDTSVSNHELAVDISGLRATMPTSLQIGCWLSVFTYTTRAVHVSSPWKFYSCKPWSRKALTS